MVRKKNNNTNKSIRRPVVIIIQHLENETTFRNTSHHIDLGEKYYSED